MKKYYYLIYKYFNFFNYNKLIFFKIKLFVKLKDIKIKYITYNILFGIKKNIYKK